MSAIDDATALVRTRLAELDTERQRLERALAELGGGKAPGKRRGRPPKASNGSSPVAATGRKRRKRKGGSRLDQAVKLIEKEPGISAGDIAKKMKIKPNYLYRVLGEAEKDGRIKKDGRNYHPVAAAA